MDYLLSQSTVDAFGAGLNAFERAKYIEGYLGRLEAGTWTFFVPGEPGKQFVRIANGEVVTVHKCTNMVAPLEPNLRVWLVYRHGELIVSHADAPAARQLFGDNAAAAQQPTYVPPANSVLLNGATVVYVLTDTATLANSSGDTNILSASTFVGSLTLPALDPLLVGDVLRVSIRGLRSTPGAGDDSFTVVLTAEGVDLHEAFSHAPGVGITDTVFSIDLLLTLRTVGASGNFYSTGDFWMDGSPVPCTPGVYSIDTTVDNDLALAVTMATADPDSIVAIHTVVVERLRAA